LGGSTGKQPNIQATGFCFGCKWKSEIETGTNKLITMLTLKIVQAKYGDCLILKYNNPQNPKYMLIDGGPGGVYKAHLKSELEKLGNDGGQLDLMVLSHVDGDHIVGLIDLTEELKEQHADGKPSVIKINELWMNSFDDSIGRDNNLSRAVQSLFSKVQNIQSTMPDGDLAFKSITQGDTLRRNALLLNIPINKVVDQNLIAHETISKSLEFDNIKITVIGPNQNNLNKLKQEWFEWIAKNEAKIMTTDQELLHQMDRSVPNLSSIMFLVEADEKTILFTGDGRGDFILEGLLQADLLDNQGKIHVDVFKVPHHGSIRNANRDFFEKVTADYYIISADGRHHNPDFETLKWIVDCAKEQGRSIELICTNKTKSTDKLEHEYPPASFGYILTFLKEKASSIVLDLNPS
jgi:beta-lactamase superfamily II metal-dependent hydrolase